MTRFHIRTLNQQDASALLQFETANRAWFEQHIEPRGEAFYSQSGVQEHVDQFLASHAAGTLHPCLIVDEGGAIVGRANLKNINQGAASAEAGYRIAQACVGKGLATKALRHLIELARDTWELGHLHAWVSSTNPASARVLEKCGFARQEEAGSARLKFSLPLISGAGPETPR